jgi:hypothetical protein
VIFRDLGRMALITRVQLRVPSSKAWDGELAERHANTHLRRLASQPTGTWTLPVDLRVDLEDGTRLDVTADYDRRNPLSVRKFVGQILARKTQSPQTDLADCVEAHRALELLEGKLLRYLLGPHVPKHLREALAAEVDPGRRLWVLESPCPECELRVGYDRRVGADRHFLDDSSLCPGALSRSRGSSTGSRPRLLHAAWAPPAARLARPVRWATHHNPRETDAHQPPPQSRAGPGTGVARGVHWFTPAPFSLTGRAALTRAERIHDGDQFHADLARQVMD